MRLLAGLVVLVFLGLPASGCSGGPEQAVVTEIAQPPSDRSGVASGKAAASVPPLELELTVDYEGAALEVGSLPDVLRGTLLLEQIDGDGLRAVLWGDGIGLVEVLGRRDGDTITLAPRPAPAQLDQGLVWDTWKMTVEDDDGDGQVDRARGRVAGTWSAVEGDVVTQAAFVATLAAVPDESGGTVRIVDEPWGGPAGVLPTAWIELVLDEPVREADARGALQLLADGRPVPGTLSAVVPTAAGVVTDLVFDPGSFLPFGATLTLATGGLRDLAGNPVRWDEASLVVQLDPGPLLANPGFETGLDGWMHNGAVETVASLAGLPALDGAAMAVVPPDAFLAGYVDVPEGATTLELGVAVLSELGLYEPGSTAVVALHAEGAGPEVIFDVAGGAEPGAACEGCDGFGMRTGPLTVAANVSAFRGQRVFLTVETAPFARPPTVSATVALVDAVRVE